MSVKGDEQRVEKVLKAPEYIKDYKITEENDGLLMYRQKQQQKKISRDNLFFEFAEEKLPIIKMERESLSLEDVFLKLTGQDVEEVESEAKKHPNRSKNRDIMDFLLKGRKKQTARELNRRGG